MVPRRDLTLKDVLSQIHKHYGLKVTSMTLHGSKLLYADFLHSIEDPVLKQSMSQLAAPTPDKRFVDLEIECVDDDDQEVDSPPVRYYFPQHDGRFFGIFKRGHHSRDVAVRR